MTVFNKVFSLEPPAALPHGLVLWLPHYRRIETDSPRKRREFMRKWVATSQKEERLRGEFNFDPEADVVLTSPFSS